MQGSGVSSLSFEDREYLFKEVNRQVQEYSKKVLQAIRDLQEANPIFSEIPIATLNCAYYVFKKASLSGNLDAYKHRVNVGGLGQNTNEILTEHRALKDHCEDVGIPVNDVNLYWHKTKDFSVKAKVTTEIKLLDAVDELIEKHLQQATEKFTPSKIKVKSKDKAIKLVLSDMHVGLDPNPNNAGLYDYTYNSDVFNTNLTHAFNAVHKEFLQHGKVDTLFIFDLGDGLDGWNGETTRGGHKLDQNMSNTEQFKTYVEGKLKLIKSFIEADFADKICVRNVVNCNHAGSFGTIANWTIMRLIDVIYQSEKIEFHILERFMEHFTFGEHCFIQTHGKDHKYMNRGLPLKLDANTINFVRNYIDKYNIKSKYIHVEKGDLHRISYEKCPTFDYRNYMSFAPPSVWAQHNFNGGYFGYSTQVIDKNSGYISHSDYFFEE